MKRAIFGSSQRDMPQFRSEYDIFVTPNSDFWMPQAS